MNFRCNGQIQIAGAAAPESFFGGSKALRFGVRQWMNGQNKVFPCKSCVDLHELIALFQLHGLAAL